jgi:hypothetical protein
MSPIGKSSKSLPSNGVPQVASFGPRHRAARSRRIAMKLTYRTEWLAMSSSRVLPATIQTPLPGISVRPSGDPDAVGPSISRRSPFGQRADAEAPRAPATLGAVAAAFVRDVEGLNQRAQAVLDSTARRCRGWPDSAIRSILRRAWSEVFASELDEPALAAAAAAIHHGYPLECSAVAAESMPQ